MMRVNFRFMCTVLTVDDLTDLNFDEIRNTRKLAETFLCHIGQNIDNDR